MTELKASGQTALRAKSLWDEVERLEESARSTTDPLKRLEVMEQALRLKDEARGLDKAARWFSYLDRMDMMGQNKGEQTKTVARKEFLRQVAIEIGTTKRFCVCIAAEGKPGFSSLFKSYEEAYRFAVPAIFDGIRKPS